MHRTLRLGDQKCGDKLTKRASFKIAVAFLMALILFHPLSPSVDAAALAKSGAGDSEAACTHCSAAPNR